MESLKKYLPAFDVLLVGGLGCGVLVLCLLIGAFAYIWRNPLGSRAPATQTIVGAGSAPILPPIATDPIPGLATPTLSPTFVPTLGSDILPTMPSFIPDFAGDPPAGKIVFTCFINQIDQICIMNADGSGRKQLTNFKGTAF